MAQDNGEKITQYRIQYYRDNKEKMKQYNVQWYRDNRDKRKKRGSDIQYKMAYYLRNRIYVALKGNFKIGSAVRDLGCSISAFKLYIENQFEDGMSWDNYGEWHLDHVLPLSSFDLTDRGDFQTAVHHLNYQPLWAHDNLSKGARI